MTVVVVAAAATGARSRADTSLQDDSSGAHQGALLFSAVRSVWHAPARPLRFAAFPFKVTIWLHVLMRGRSTLLAQSPIPRAAPSSTRCAPASARRATWQGNSRSADPQYRG